jgi:polo-like kinase 1
LLKFVDFSAKYGMGYKLSNGQYGVLFNDSTKIVLDPNCFHFDYIQRQNHAQEEQVSHYDCLDFPKAIQKKVVLLQHFKSYLDGNQKFKPLDFTASSGKPPPAR